MKPLDAFLGLPAFSGFERPDFLPTGIIAAEAGNPWVGEMLAHFDTAKFPKVDLRAVPLATKKMFPDFRLDNTTQHLPDVSFFASEYFCPIDKHGVLTLTENTHAVHHFAGSWMSSGAGCPKTREKELRKLSKGVH